MDRSSTWDYGNGNAHTLRAPSPSDTEETPDSVRSTLANRMPSQISVGASPSEAGEAAETPDAEAVGAEDDEPSTDGTDDKWRLDKHGNPLNPPALYMRFYRSIRSIMAN